MMIERIMYNNIRNIFGIILIIAGIFDAIKYWIQANKIKKVQTSKGISRRFTNYSIFNNICRLIYSIIIKDVYIFAIVLLGFICLCKLYCIQYIYYPYKKRGLKKFKRPNIMIYIINSILPNSLRKRL